MALLRLDEIGGVEVISHLVAHEPQPRERSLDRPPPGGGLGFHGALVGMAVISHQGGVDDGDHHTASLITANPCPWSSTWSLASRSMASRIAVMDHSSALASACGSPVCSRFHATRQRGRQNRACSRRGVEHGAALLTGPGLGHPPMLRTPWAHVSLLMLGIPGARQHDVAPPRRPGRPVPYVTARGSGGPVDSGHVPGTCPRPGTRNLPVSVGQVLTGTMPGRPRAAAGGPRPAC